MQSHLWFYCGTANSIKNKTKKKDAILPVVVCIKSYYQSDVTDSITQAVF